MERYFKKIDKNNNRSLSQNSLPPLLNLPNANCTEVPISLELVSSDPDDNDVAESSSKKPAKRKLSSVYCKSWEDDNILKPWLTQNGKQNAFCRYCNCELKAMGGIGDLYAHAKRKKHIQAANAINIHSESPILKVIGNMRNLSGHNKQVAMTEIQLSAFCAEHNIPFLAMNHMIPMLQSAIPYSTIVRHVKYARTKTTCVVKNVIGETQLQELINLMKVQPFSICIDESTDIATVKLLSIVVRTEYLGRIRDFFFALIKVEICDAQSLYEKIVELFLARGIDYKTFLVGFAADGANVMTGVNHSVATLLKNECPYLIIFKCVCHSFALCANYACAALPKFVEATARAIYNFIQNSPKRIHLFASLQILLNYKPKKMLHPAQTRWLSLEATVNQILSRLDVLKLFFVHEDLEKYESTDEIIENILNPLFELYLKFLKYILNDLNKLNRLFQSESPQLHRLNCDVKRLYTKFLEYFIKDQFVEEVAYKKICLENADVLKDINEIYLGADVASSLCVLNDSQQYEFRGKCQQFLIELCNQLLKRLDFNNQHLVVINSIAPGSVVNRENGTISNLCKMFPNLVASNEYQDIDDEWREVRRIDFHNYLLSEHDDIETFWANIFLIKHGDGTTAFPKLQKLIMALLTIPITTANVERIFSQININKNKLRNKLDETTLSGILLTKDYMSKRGYTCVLNTNRKC